MKNLLLLITAVLVATQLYGAERDDFLAEGNRQFEAMAWPDAIAAYKSAVAQGHHAPELFYNLGSAHYKNDAPGPAGLWFRRALLLDPDLPEARLNLQFLDRTLGAGQLSEGVFGWLAQYQRWLYWGSILSILLAILVFGCVVRDLLVGRSIPSTLPMLLLGLLLFLVPGWLVLQLGSTRLEEQATAIVLADLVPVRTAPFESASTLASLPASTPLRILDTQVGPWWYLELPGGERGYARKESLARLWPIEPTQTP